MNYIKTLLVFTLLLLTQLTKAQNGDDYLGRVQTFTRYYNEQKFDSIYYMFDTALRIASPLEMTAKRYRKLYNAHGPFIQLRPEIYKNGLVHITGFFANDSVSILSKLHFQTFRFEMLRITPYHYDTLLPKKNNFFTMLPTGGVYGTLAEPPGYSKVPVVIIIGATGWIDRDGNSPYGINGNSYKMLSDSLVKAGIAVLRYDKRGLGESAATLYNDDSLSFDYYIEDAIELTKFLKLHYRFSKVFVLGHNEGSLVGMKVAQAVKVAGYISISGPARRADKVILRQTKMPTKELKAKAAEGFDSLAAGYTLKNVDYRLDDMLGAEKQLYLRSWLQYTPTEEIKKITAPILLLQGTEDKTIDKKDGKRLKKANSAATLTYIKGMNFVLKDTPDGTSSFKEIYNDPTLPLSPALTPALVQFIKGVK